MTKVIKKGIKDCHAKGVDSVVLGLTEEGRLRRAFIAHPGHDLGMGSTLSVGFHAHHCDVTLEVVHGAMLNINLAAGRSHLSYTSDYMELATYEYESPILNGGKGSFTRVSKMKPHDIQTIPLSTMSEPLFLTANVVHTILIPFFLAETCTWVVTEGEEDPEYYPFVYTNRDLRYDTMQGLYNPMDDAEADVLIAKVEDQLAKARAMRLEMAAMRKTADEADPMNRKINLPFKMRPERFTDKQLDSLIEKICDAHTPNPNPTDW